MHSHIPDSFQTQTGFNEGIITIKCTVSQSVCKI